MNNQNQQKNRKWKFSLYHLLALTAFAALSIAVVVAYRKNDALKQSRAALISLSSQLNVTDEDEFTSVALPKIASDFETWEVHVPRSPELELRLGIGEVSEFGIPAQFDRVRLSAGRHRVTLHTVVSADDGNRLVVYVDGNQVIEKTPGRDWMSGGWNSSHGISWPQEPTAGLRTAHQLTGKRYTPRIDVGKNNYFNGSDDNLVTNPGYRLWIDQPGRTYEPASPFYGFQNDDRYRGIGLRDGLRYKIINAAAYEWAFTRPKSRGRDPVLRIVPEFIVDGQIALSSRTSSFSSWQLHNDADRKEAVRWERDPKQTTSGAFLHATFNSEKSVKPVIELKWDADRPNEVGLRLANTQANERITQLRLRIVGGSEHLWRLIDTGKQKLDSRKKPKQQTTNSSGMMLSLDSAEKSESDTQITWQTNESLPLQILQRNRRRKPNPYSGVPLYQGLPLKFAARIPASFAPSISVTRINQHPIIPEQPFPGGAIFDEIQIEIDAKQNDWIWLQVQDLTGLAVISENSTTSSAKEKAKASPVVTGTADGK